MVDTVKNRNWWVLEGAAFRSGSVGRVPGEVDNEQSPRVEARREGLILKLEPQLVSRVTVSGFNQPPLSLLCMMGRQSGPVLAG
ncbi:hypothetical protein BHM03_00040493 [Ensete ventricosum]|nr:hypothetical protein BHM03_00040493 [Ensete ventricosum]